MEIQIVELIAKSGAYTIIIAILFYYAVYSFKTFNSDKAALRNDLTVLQKEFHDFKNHMIDKLVLLSTETKGSIDNLSDAIERNYKCKS